MTREGDDRGDKPFQFTDRRRLDPTTGIRREPDTGVGPRTGGASPFPGAGPVGSGDPGDPVDAGQPISVEPNAELQAAQQEAAERTSDLQRVTAEYANYRKRVERDREAVALAAKATVLTDMLPVLDDVDRATAHGDLTGAFKSVADKLSGVLTKIGLQSVGAQGDPFDPALHEAVQFATSADVAEPTVSAVLRHGYAIGERLVRPAVVVVTGPEHDDVAPTADGESDETDEVLDGEVVDSDDSGDADQAPTQH